MHNYTRVHDLGNAVSNLPALFLVRIHSVAEKRSLCSIFARANGERFHVVSYLPCTARPKSISRKPKNTLLLAESKGEKQMQARIGRVA